MQIYTALRNRIVAAQPLDRQAHLSQCLDKLMADVQRNLEPKNRDKFTQVHYPRWDSLWCALLLLPLCLQASNCGLGSVFVAIWAPN